MTSSSFPSFFCGIFFSARPVFRDGIFNPSSPSPSRLLKRFIDLAV
jgi:hypothetical protein